MDGKLVIVTGYFGAPVKEFAQRISQAHEIPLIDLDKLIEEKDGRSIKRLVMMNGEHGYRNNEYEQLKELSEKNEPAVVFCGDGVLHDDDSKAIIADHDLIIVGGELTNDQLWAKASLADDTYHAFMSFGTDEEKRQAFDKLIERQRTLFGGKS